MSSTRVAAAGAELHVEVGGDRSAAPLVLLNGARCNTRSWQPVLAELERRFFVIRHDLRGTGRSRGAPPWDFDRYADDVACLLDHFEVDRAHVWAMAFGSRVGLRLAVRHPQRVALLALFDATVFPPSTRERMVAGLKEARRQRQEAGLAELATDDDWFAQDDPQSASLAYSATASQLDESHVLAKVAAPTCLATGVLDDNLEGTRAMAQGIADAELHELPMCAHGSVLQRPGLALDTFLDFVKRREAR